MTKLTHWFWSMLWMNIAMWGSLSCLSILQEPIWSLPDRPSLSDSSACSGGCGRCSQTASQTLSGKWCWPQHCLRGAQGQMAHLNRRNVFSHGTLCEYFYFSSCYILFSFLFCICANLSLSPLPPADDDSLRKCSALWSSWLDQKYEAWPWQNAAVSSTRSHCWRKDPLTQKQHNITQAGIRLTSTTLVLCMFRVIHLSSQNKSWSPSGCKAGPQSCRPVSLWPHSPSSTQTQTLFCVFPDECRKHSHKHQQAVDAGAENKWPVV